MKYLIISLILFILSIASFVGLYFEIKKLDYTDSDTEKKCTDNHNVNLKNNDKCGAWDGHQCRKGIFTDKDGKCTADGSYIPMLLLSTGILCFVSFVIFMVIGLTHKQI